MEKLFYFLFTHSVLHIATELHIELENAILGCMIILTISTDCVFPYFRQDASTKTL